jgi:hypothetical protein
MFRILICTGGIIAGAVRPAAAFWIRVGDGYLFIPDGLLLLGLGAFGVFTLAAMCGAFSSSSSSDGELSTTESADYYDNEASRLRAISRKLEAETDLAESVIKAKRTRAELEDIEEIFRDGKSRRRR